MVAFHRRYCTKLSLPKVMKEPKCTSGWLPIYSKHKHLKKKKMQAIPGVQGESGLHETSFFFFFIKECVISKSLQSTDVPPGRSNIDLNNVDASNAQMCRVIVVMSEYQKALATRLLTPYLLGLLNIYFSLAFNESLDIDSKSLLSDAAHGSVTRARCNFCLKQTRLLY